MCGYSLRGLAARGTCPKCGMQYTATGCIVGGFALVLAYAAVAFFLNVNVMQP